MVFAYLRHPRSNADMKFGIFLGALEKQVDCCPRCARRILEEERDRFLLLPSDHSYDVRGQNFEKNPLLRKAKGGKMGTP